LTLGAISFRGKGITVGDEIEMAQQAAQVLCRYLTLSRVEFDGVGFVPPLRVERFEKELLAGNRSFYGVDVALDPPVIRADTEHDGFFLEYVWHGGFQNRLRLKRFDNPELVARAKALLDRYMRTGPLGGDGEFRGGGEPARKTSF
jgi:hypothetical protein